MQGVNHNVQIQDYIFVILKPIQTKISVCFDPIIYPLESHQLAGRLVCLQLHMDSWCMRQEMLLRTPDPFLLFEEDLGMRLLLELILMPAGLDIGCSYNRSCSPKYVHI